MPRHSTKSRRAPKRSRRTGPLGTTVDTAPAPPPELTPEQVNAILRQHVEIARAAFFRLAQYRAADRVRYGELDWNQAGGYINDEVNGLDAQIAAAS